jgi:hypothetical protein
MRSGVRTASSNNGYVEAEYASESSAVVRPIEGDPALDQPILEAYRVARESAEREVPRMCAERNRLIRARAQHHDTTGGDTLVVDTVRVLGVAAALVTGVVLGLFANSAGGAIAGVAACLAGWAVTAAGASAAVRYTRRLLTKQARERLRIVGALTRSIRRLDKRIARARLEFGLSGHAPLPRL